MNKEEIDKRELTNRFQPMIDNVEQQMAAMYGMNLYKQKEGFTQEQLYLYGGKLDSVFTLTLREESEAFKKYGGEITVCFVYTRDERKSLEEDSSSLNNIPCVKAKLLLPYGKRHEDKAKELLEGGLDTKDIVQALVLPPLDKNNTFPSKEKRTPKVLEIPIEAEEKGREIYFMYGFLKRLKESCVGMMPSDKSRYLAYKLILEAAELTEDEKSTIFNAEGEIKNNDVAYYYLMWKDKAGIIKDKEKGKLDYLIHNQFFERVALLETTLKEIDLDLKKFTGCYPKSTGLIFEKIMNFHDKSFNTTGKFPLYMDFKSLLHIYFRHTNELNVSSQYANRDKFQLEEKDIMTVIDFVMRQLNDEYQAFKEEHPDSRFFRAGKMAYYYNGDYYHVNVESDGRISTFYKASGNKRKESE